MNEKAAIFASRLTGIIALGLAIFLWKPLGITGLIGGLVCAGFWFALSWYLQKK
ncbi:hypothetical protein H2C83_12075 [Thermoactinomyces sp. AMNI-1]|uniref:Uncharacterized protein n=2 Tax=Thermoactinomyces mirandus TaxID=2756294 RepID=A0A7W1XTR5_9BACL|nr:hypothetical protein [Thermoactinomyces mirandus]